MIDDRFTAKTGIHVNLKLVSSDVLLPSTVAGNGPDIALQVGNDVPVNYASRNALQDLSVFPDFEASEGSSLTPALWCLMNIMATITPLPEQQTFPMLFYRKDILEDELKLKVPQTWEDVYDMLPTLQKHNLQFGLPQKPLDPSVTIWRPRNMTLPPNPPLVRCSCFRMVDEFYKDDGKRAAWIPRPR